MGQTLTERQQAVLGMIVSEYVTTAMPVGSDTVVKKYCPGVSPATIRHDMGVLASAGYVYHPHPSAGRVPTAKGYRYYVHHLMHPVDLGSDERCTIDHLFHQVERDLDQWMHLSAAVLAQLTGNAAFVTLPVVRRSRFRHLDLIATQDHSAVLVALLQEGTVHQHLVVHPDPLEQEQLDHVARWLNAELRGMPLLDVEKWSSARSSLERSVRDSLASVMRRVDQQAVPGVWYEGVSSLLAQPEFVRSEKAQEVLRAFEQRQILGDIAEAVLEYPGVRVLIGDEVPWQAFRECSIVATRYGSVGSEGVVAVVGPTRMRYDRVIATIQYLGGVMTDLWAELCE